MYTASSKVGSLVPVGTGVLGIEALTAAAVHGEYIAMNKVAIRRVYFCVTVATVSSADIQVAFKKRPTIGSATGETTIGTLKIPTAKAAGTVMYLDIDEDLAPLLAGQSLALEVTVAAAGGGAAGQGYYGFDLVDSPEYAANMSNLVKSA
jgi:hypothetical protein